MTKKFSFDVFLSHNSRDKARVRRLAERLKRARLRVWFDEWIIKPGDDIYLAIEHGLEAARVQVLCLSPAALGSDWVALERSTVLFRDPSNVDRRFIPLLLADCELPDALRRYKYVDFRQEEDAAFEELLSACRPEEAQEDLPPQEVEKAHPSLLDKLLPKKRREKPPAKPTKPKTKGKSEKQPEQTELLAVLERKLKGHKDWVNSVAVSPNGKWVASGSDDETVKIWDLETGSCRATLEGHTQEVNCVAITPDGKRILSSSTDRTIRVWDAATARPLVAFDGHKEKVWSVAVLPGGQQALSGGWDNQLLLWDIASGNCLKVIKGSEGEAGNIFCVAVTQDGKRAVSGQSDGKIHLWNLETGESLATLKGHVDLVRSAQVIPGGRYAISASDDTTVKVWDLETGTCVGTLEGHQSQVYSILLSPDGKMIASSGFTDDTVRLWDWKSGACLHVIENEDDAFPISVAFSPNGSYLVVGTATTIYVYRLTGVIDAPPAEPSRRYVNAKVVLIGESAVGKTTLAHRLIEDRYVKTDSTHGMNVWRLDLPLPEDDTLEREALLWDLAGQEDYRLIH